ncbi:hypothetical protein LCGC14_2024920 [marine sediment metagenome]|uniref:Uncharacterized protein n=1 Tax=marine sediment metagenome TaxID=412755 RepID=A0A0F9EWF4_9ZZZZ
MKVLKLYLKGFLLLVAGLYMAHVAKLVMKVDKKFPSLSGVLRRILLPDAFHMAAAKLAIEELMKDPERMRLARENYPAEIQGWLQDLSDEQLKVGEEKLRVEMAAHTGRNWGFDGMQGTMLLVDAGIMSEEEIMELLENERWLREHRRKHSQSQGAGDPGPGQK